MRLASALTAFAGDCFKPGESWARILIALCLGFSAVVQANSVKAESVVESRRIEGLLHPSFSPDASHLALSYQGAIFVLNASSGVFRQITTGPGWDIEPVWSPDGTNIVFLRGENSVEGELFIVDTAGGVPLSLAPGVTWRSRVWFTPDGEKILGHARSATDQGIGILNLSTRQIHYLPVGQLEGQAFRLADIQVALLQGGTKMIVARHKHQPGEQSGFRGEGALIESMDVATGRRHRVIDWPTTIEDISLGPRPGQVLIESRDGGILTRLFLLDIETLTVMPLPVEGSIEHHATIANGQLAHIVRNLDGDRLVQHTVGNEEKGGTPLAVQLPPDRTATLRLRVQMRQSEDTIPARVSIRSENGKYVFPRIDRPHHLILTTSPNSIPEGFFISTGDDTIEMAPGTYQIRVARGLETKVVEREFSVASGQRKDLSILLDRWIDMAKQGWWSGENHVHANYENGTWAYGPTFAVERCHAEDLNLCNLVSANSLGSFVYDRDYVDGTAHRSSDGKYLASWGQEFRSSFWGHLTVAGLGSPLLPPYSGFADSDYPNNLPGLESILKQVMAAGAMPSFTHIAGGDPDNAFKFPYSARALPIEAAAGRIGLIDLHGPNYRGSISVWYHLLNCGLPVYASAGTDTFMNHLATLPPGWARTYVRLDKPFTERAWLGAQRKGQSFVTNGPMIDFTLAARRSGETIFLERPRNLTMKLRIASPVPLDRVELIVNGQVVADMGGINAYRARSFERQIPIDQSGWVAIRVSGQPTEHTVRFPAAHSNPVWIQLEGYPNRFREQSAAVMLRHVESIGRLMDRQARFVNSQAVGDARLYINVARNFYRKKTVPKR